MQLGIIVKGLRQQKVKTMEEALHLLNFGEEYRKYRVTDYNTHSSRSHTIYKVYVESYNMDEVGSKMYTLSCLVSFESDARTWLILQDLKDLARILKAKITKRKRSSSTKACST